MNFHVIHPQSRTSVVLALGALLLGAGCTRTAGPEGGGGAAPGESGINAASGKVSAETVQYKLVGEVRRIDKNDREVTIRHEAIPGFMDAMTMPFRLDDAAAMEDLSVGDEVEGRLEVTREAGRTRSYRLFDLTVTRPAPATSLTLNLSGATPELRARPRRLQPGEAVPPFELTGQDGKLFRLSDLRGKVVVLTFIYTRCPIPNFCPAMDRRFADLAASISANPGRAEQIRLLSVSFDPDHDTPDVLRKHAQIRGGVPPLWSFAVASHQELARVGPLLGLVYGPGKNEIIHNLCTAVIDPEGRLARLEVGTRSNEWTSADLLKTVYGLTPPGKK
ncbi:MAG: SCO family protein [Isosphaeraceae bacterium]